MKEHDALLAEIAEIEAMLAKTPSEYALALQSLNGRRLDLQARLTQLQSSGVNKARVELTFKGRPVHSSEGIFASFAGKVLETYERAISLLQANLTRRLQASGRIPGRGPSRLMITDRALGSFGFVLEEILQQEDGTIQRDALLTEVDRKTAMTRATEQAEAILRASQASDDDLAEAASETDRRTLHALRDFLIVVAEGGAHFRHKSDTGSGVVFTDAAAVAASAERLSDDNIEESTDNLAGILDGIMPGRRWFEFIADGDLGRISGKIDQSIDDEAVTGLKQHMDQRLRITVHVTRVGHGRSARKYRLLAWDPSGQGRQESLGLE